jgi:hypothetical protein
MRYVAAALLVWATCASAHAQPSARISFHSEPAGVTLHRRTGTVALPVMIGRVPGIIRRGLYADVCISPCEAFLPSGQQRLALSLGGGVPHELATPIPIYGDTTIDGRYVSRSDERLAGALTIGAGILIALPLFLGGLLAPSSFMFEEGHVALMITSGAIALGGILAGVILLYQHDYASIRYESGIR